MITHYKQSADLSALYTWMDARMSATDVLVCSSEMFLYGGLIQSRTTNDAESVILTRLQRLVEYKDKYPRLKVYLSGVVMRIPAYDGDFEEPTYWADYGRDVSSC